MARWDGVLRNLSSNRDSVSSLEVSVLGTPELLVDKAVAGPLQVPRCLVLG